MQPQVDGGRYPFKRTEGDLVHVSANVFKDGHDILRAVVRYRRAGARRWQERPFEPVGNDRWEGGFEVGVVRITANEYETALAVAGRAPSTG